MHKVSPRLVMVAGPNGSGKSTLIEALRASPVVDLPAFYVNADNLQRERNIQDPIEAQRLAKSLRTQALADHNDILYETVMSHPSKLAELQTAKAAGYHITIHFVATADANINVERVALRVASGGHDVPPDRTRKRYLRTLTFAPIAISYADSAVIFDNSVRGDMGEGLLSQAALQGDRLVPLVDTPIAWVQRLISQFDERVSELQVFSRDIVQSSGLSPQHARLDNGHTSGPIVAIGKHYVLQYDEPTHAVILHDRLLLTGLDNPQVNQESFDIRYSEGVTQIHFMR